MRKKIYVNNKGDIEIWSMSKTGNIICQWDINSFVKYGARNTIHMHPDGISGYLKMKSLEYLGDLKR